MCGLIAMLLVLLSGVFGFCGVREFRPRQRRLR